MNICVANGIETKFTHKEETGLNLHFVGILYLLESCDNLKLVLLKIVNSNTGSSMGKDMCV